MASSSPLVFITYDNKKNGRNHDPKRKREVRKQAFHFSRAKSALRANISRKRAPEQADVSPSRGTNRPQSLEKSVARCDDATKKSWIPQFLSDRPSYVSGMGYDAWETLNFYHHSHQRSLVALDPESDYLAFTMRDSTALQAHLYLIATDMVSKGHLRGEYLSDKFKRATLSAVREGLGALNGAPSDSLTYAVAALGTVESTSGHKTIADAHYKGLLQMIALKGGMLELSKNSWMTRTILWSRRCHCLRWHDILGLPEMPSDTRPSYEPLPDGGEDEVIAHDSLQYGGVISRELTGVATNLKALTRYPAATSSQRRRISDAIYEVEYKLLLLAQRHLASLPALTGFSISLSKAYHLAAQLYVFLVLRQVPIGAPMVARFSKALAEELESSSSKHFIRKRDGLSVAWQRLLLWIKVLLALATKNSRFHRRSFELLLLSVDSQELSGFAAFRQAISDVGWMSGILEDELLIVWEKVAAMRFNNATSTQVLNIRRDQQHTEDDIGSGAE